ncbi:MAG: tol-pal system protein YbgF [Rhodospirillaceae bacterium]|nr:tol-pal system protein YbgF [Rhodospirillaceae bacterium]
MVVMGRMFPRNTRAAWLAAIVATGVAVALPIPAAAQNADIRSLNERLDMMQREFRTLLGLNERLQRDMRDLQNDAARTGPRPATGGPAPSGSSPSLAAELDSRLSAFDEQVRGLTGKIEELTFTVAQLRGRLDKLVGDVDFRLSALEKASPGAVAERSPADAGNGQARPGGQQAALPAATLPAGPPQEQYDFAYGLLLKAQRDQVEMVKAEQALAAFVAAHPEHKLAGNAQYWLGETFYVRNDYARAATAFGEGYKKYPKGDKAPDLLLKLGMSLAALGQKQPACAAYAQIDREIPTAPPPIKQQVLAQKQRTGC